MLCEGFDVVIQYQLKSMIPPLQNRQKMSRRWWRT